MPDTQRSVPCLVLDTNVFVAAGFNPHSHSTKILDRIRDGAWRMAWNEATRRETRAILTQIPRLSWHDVEHLFRPDCEHVEETRPEDYGAIEDPDDRKYAALAAAAGAVLVTSDEHLLAHRCRLPIEILSPREVMSRYNQRTYQGA